MNEAVLSVLAVTNDSAVSYERALSAVRADGPLQFESVADLGRCMEAVRDPGRAPDILLLDGLLPTREGAQPECVGAHTVNEIKTLAPGTEVIFLPSCEGADALAPLRAGAFHCLRKPFDAADLQMVLARAAEHCRLRRGARERRVLLGLVKSTAGLLDGRSRLEMVGQCLRAVHGFGFDRARIYLMNHNGKKLVGYAQSGSNSGISSLTWPVETLPPKLFLKRGQRQGAAVRTPQSSFSEPLGPDAADEFAYVPLFARGRARGLIVADNKPSGLPPTRESLDALGMFAGQAASAMENARVFERMKDRADQLEALRKTSLAITVTQDKGLLLRTIIEQAVKLLRAKNGGIYKFYPTLGELKVVTDFRRPEHVNRTLRVGHGMAGRLVQSGRPFMIVDNYREWLHKAGEGREAGEYKDRCPYGAVLEVLLKWQGKIIGVIYVDDQVGRNFTPKDARLLGLFADQAAIALANAELLAKDDDKFRRLKKLANAIKEMMGDLGTRTLDERLNLIARHAADILNAESCGVHIVRREGYLRLEASYGHREGGFVKGREFRICSGPKSGLTGHIAHRGKLFILHGEALRRHFAVQGEEPNHLGTGRCDSIVALPLKKKVAGRKKLIGLLRADNKRDPADATQQELEFTPTDRWMMHIFAKAVVIALESAELVEHLERLVASSPNGVVVLDRKGQITRFNDKAAEILGYAAEEVLGRHLSVLYGDPDEPRKIGKLLHQSPGGRLTDYEANVRSKSGELIPIRHSSAWLYDSLGERAGSVGYFEDLRGVRHADQRSELLLLASQIVANATNCAEGLRSLAEMIVSHLPHTFCRILLLDETGAKLVVGASYVSPLARCEGDPVPHINEPICLAEWPGLHHILEAGKPLTLHYEREVERGVLVRLSVHLGLKVHVRSLLLVPLQVDGRFIGLLEMGESEKTGERPFTKDEVDFVATIAANTRSLIYRARLYEQTKQRGQLLESLHIKLTTLFGISDFMQSARDLESIFHVLLTGVTAHFGLRLNRAALLLYDRDGENFTAQLGIGKFDREATFKEWGLVDEANSMDDFKRYIDALKRGPLPLTPVGERLRGLRLPVAAGAADAFSRAVREPRVMVLTRREVEALPGEFVGAFEPGLPFVVVPLEAHDRLVGLLVADNKFTGAPVEGDLDFLSALAANAAFAIENIRLLEQTRAALVETETLHRAALALAGAHSPKRDDETLVERMLHTIVNYACQMFDADSSTVWPCVQGKFLPKELISRGLSEEALENFRSLEPMSNGTTYAVLERGWVPVTNVADEKYDFLRPEMRTLLRESGVQSFQGVALKVGTESVGVLYVSYNQRRSFPEKERRLLENFATNAALFVNNARLLDQVRTANRLAEVVAEVTALGGQDNQEKLNSIANRTREAVGCDAVVLYAYDRTKNRWEYPPSWSGVRHPKEAWPNDTVPSTSIVYAVLNSEEPHIAEKVDAEDSLFRGRNFPVREGIKSAAAFPLRAAGQPVGIMFINYRKPHRFTPDEIRNIRLFANQSAVAILNTQLYREQIYEQEELLSLSRTLLGTFQKDEALKGVVRHGLKALRADYCDIVLPDGQGRLAVAAADRRDGRPGEYLMRHGAAEHAAYTMGRTNSVVSDYEKESRFEVPPAVRDSGVKSGLSHPVWHKDEAVGALRVHTRAEHEFTEAEQNLLALIATLTTIAIGSAEHRDELLRTKEKLAEQSALARIGIAESSWTHSITLKALVFKENAESLLKFFDADDSRERYDGERQRIREKLTLIQEQAQEILNMPITTPLIVKEVGVNEFLRERVTKLCEQRGSGVRLEWELKLDEETAIRISPEWFNWAVLDVIVANALEAMAGLPCRLLTVSTQADGKFIRMKIADSGRGVPPEIEGKLFNEPILSNMKGNGIGLFLAAKVLETFSGYIVLDKTGPAGTCFAISLPAVGG